MKTGGENLNIEENESILIHIVKSQRGTLENVLRDEMGISGRLFRSLYKNKGILYNKKSVKKNEIIEENGIITIMMEDEKHNYRIEDMELDIVYEDNDIIILNKQPGIVMYPTKNNDAITIANGIASYFSKKNIKKKIRFVNRLDMYTSGILIIAKNPFGHQQMSKQFEEDTVEKKYLVLVEGIVKENFGEINEPICKNEENPIKNKVSEKGKPSLTKFTVIERYNNASLIEAQIITGRTHQIRVHMSYIGHPVIGDSLYNNPSSLINRQALHSYSLKFDVPRTRERIEVKAVMPKDMEDVINKIK